MTHGPLVRDEVIRRNEARKNKIATTAANDKKKLHKLVTEVEEIRHKQATEQSFTLLNRHLEKLIQWKKQKGDAKMPSKKVDLLKRWRETKGRQSPHIIPYSFDDEYDGDDDGVDPEGEEEEDVDPEGGEEDDIFDSDDETDEE